MRYLEDKGCYNQGPKTSQNTPNRNGAAATTQVSHNNQRTTMGKQTPSKWDDAQKWLVGLSKVSEKSQSKNKPRNSNADDLRLITHMPQKEHDYSSSTIYSEAETKKVEWDESIWRSNDIKALENTIQVQSIFFRDMGTEMTPIASEEPSRNATPIRATSPIHSGTSTPMRGQKSLEGASKGQQWGSREGSSPYKKIMSEKKVEDHATKLNPLEIRAIAWDEAERAKYMARFNREEVKIQAWETHQIRKAEMEMKKLETYMKGACWEVSLTPPTSLSR
ncbi:putative remorin [Lupinus albus]|uniref:Putative remorin n=1 Tax=Lupinus albus TaxID=3870 RepID=A0A6A4PI01_LUPAL|nr:putative remorin [Lupinus albus]